MSKSPPRDPPDVVVSSPLTPTPGAILKVSAEEPTTGIPLEGLSRQHGDDQANAADSITLVSDRKGKGKARAVDPVDELENYDLQEDADAVRMESTHVFQDDNDVADYAEDSTGDLSSGNGAYPPMGDDDLEERRVTETLKRWEEAERQRRKALRDSNRSSNSHRNSLVGDVGWRASKLWKEGAQRRTSLRKGAMRLRDDESPTRRTSTVTWASGVTRRSGGDDDNGKNGSLPASRSTTLSTAQEKERARSASPSSPTPLVSNNPFSTPRMGSPVSFEDRSASAYGYKSRIKSTADDQEDALMEGTSNPPTPALDRSTSLGQTQSDPEYPDRPILQASGSYSLDTLSAKNAGNERRSKSSLPPPPRALDLPEEVIASPTATTTVPARTISPMLIERSEVEIAEDDEMEAREAAQGRWWTDWLCGCRESGRLGQDQAGRTNPFE